MIAGSISAPLINDARRVFENSEFLLSGINVVGAKHSIVNRIPTSQAGKRAFQAAKRDERQASFDPGRRGFDPRLPLLDLKQHDQPIHWELRRRDRPTVDPTKRHFASLHKTKRAGMFSENSVVAANSTQLCYLPRD
jgi:coproporphyrinogen III oxidase